MEKALWVSGGGGGQSSQDEAPAQPNPGRREPGALEEQQGPGAGAGGAVPGGAMGPVGRGWSLQRLMGARSLGVTVGVQAWKV